MRSAGTDYAICATLSYVRDFAFEHGCLDLIRKRTVRWPALKTNTHCRYGRRCRLASCLPNYLLSEEENADVERVRTRQRACE